MRPLVASQWFSSLDLKSGYWQGKQTIYCYLQWGHWAFRLTNTSATFQRLMGTFLGVLNLHWCIIYLDDIVIFSRDLASHLEMLEAVFWKLEEARLKLKPSKCELFWWQIVYLGHIVSIQGIATDEGKIEAIKKWPVQTNIMEVWSFLWFMGYYQWFIP